MGKKKTQIGWYVLEKDTEFTNTFECAAWYENVMCKAGRYPLYVYDYGLRNGAEGQQVTGYIDMAYADIPGIITSDDFGARYFGVPVGEYDTEQHKGNESNHVCYQYLYAVADEIMNPESIHKADYRHYELLPEYEPKEIRFMYDGEEVVTHGIFKMD